MLALIFLIFLNPAFAADVVTPSAFALDWSPYPLTHLDLPAAFTNDLLDVGCRTLGEVLLGGPDDLMELPHFSRDAFEQLNTFLDRRRIPWLTSIFGDLPWSVRIQLFRAGVRSGADLAREPRPDLAAIRAKLDARWIARFDQTVSLCARGLGAAE